MILTTARILGGTRGTAARVLALAVLGRPDHEHSGVGDVDEWEVFAVPVDFDQR